MKRCSSDWGLDLIRAEVRVSRRAQRDLQRTEKAYLGAVAEALRRLVDSPLVGKPLGGDLEGVRSLCVGVYRVAYRFDPRQNMVDVAWIRHWREAYGDAR